MNRIFTLLAILATTSMSAQDASEFPCTLVNDHNTLLLELVKTTPGFTPPVAARAFGYTGLALYESIQPGMPAHSSFSGMLNELEDVPQPDGLVNLHWPTVANNAVATITENLFSNMSPENALALETLKADYNSTFQTEISPEEFNASAAYGELVADHIFNYSMTDGGYDCQLSNFPEDYIPPVGDGMWAPLQGQSALQPYWGENRAFVEANNDPEVLPTFLPEYSSAEDSEFYDYAYNVYEAVNNATTEEINIANWWADGGGTITPPGHSISMMSQTLEETEAKLDQAALVYCVLGMSLSDAFLACWESKYIHNVLRPVVFINEHIDAEWTTPVGTPPFPEYVSGHSSQSGAMGTVMTHFFGENYAFSDDTYSGEFGSVRNFDSFWHAAQEAAVSRLYGGIHYVFSNDEGLYLGERVANNILSLMNTVSIGDEMASAPALVPFPNPTVGTVQFKNVTAPVASIEVYNSLGARVISVNNVDRVDLSGLPDGTYVLSYQSSQGETYNHHRIVKM